MSHVFDSAWIILVAIGIGFLLISVEHTRTQLRETANAEGLGDEYEAELNRILELERLQPKDAWPGPSPYRQALANVRRNQRMIAKSRAFSEQTRPVTYNISNHILNSTITALNLGMVLGDLNTFVQILQTHGDQQIADAIERLTIAIGKSAEIRDADFEKTCLKTLRWYRMRSHLNPINVDRDC